jgi:L-arabinose isomerase
LKDPLGTPFIDERIIDESKKVLKNRGIELVEHDTIIAARQEAIEAFRKMKSDDGIDCVILFSGTWVWAGNIIAAVRDYVNSGGKVVVWTHPGSQGWRPVGGLVMHGALKEVGIDHRFVYGSWDSKKDMDAISSYCKAAHLKNYLNMSRAGVFGGRGMGQTCGAADPSQWMKIFGIDIDSRDTTSLINKAKSIREDEIKELLPRLKELFEELPQGNDAFDRSLRLYLALKAILKEEGFDFYTIQSFPGLADDYSATCFTQSMMLEDGIPTSTLSDFNTLMTVILLTKLSRERVYYGDLQHIDKESREIKIIGDGAVPPSLAGSLEKAKFAEHGIPTEGSAGGLAVSLVCKPGEGVLARLGRNDGEFEMIITRCTVFEPTPEEIKKRKEECGIPFWPHAFVKAHCDMEILLESWNNEYACLGYGESLYNDLIEFCRMMKIRTILP